MDGTDTGNPDSNPGEGSSSSSSDAANVAQASNAEGAVSYTLSSPLPPPPPSTVRVPQDLQRTPTSYDPIGEPTHMTIDDLQHSHNLYSRQGSFLVGPGVTAEDMNIPDEETSRWLHGPMTRGDAVSRQVIFA